MLNVDADLRSSVLSPANTSNPDFLGAWLASTFDADRSVSIVAKRSWESALSGQEIDVQLYSADLLAYLREYLLLSDNQEISSEGTETPPSFTPMKLKAASNASTPQMKLQAEATPSPSTRDDATEDAQSRSSRLFAGASEALIWLLKNTTIEDQEALDSLLSSPALWNVLSPSIEGAKEALPVARRACWTLLAQLLSLPKDPLQPHLEVVATCAMFAAFQERDYRVQGQMWDGLLALLKCKSSAWSLASKQSDEEDSDSDEGEESDASSSKTASDHGDSIPPLFQAFLSFLSTGCPVNSARNYPAVLVLLSTIPEELVSFTDEEAPNLLFDAMWQALICSPMLHAVAEALAFIIRKIDSPEHAQNLAMMQMGKLWEALLAEKTVGKLDFLVHLFKKLKDESEDLVQPAWLSIDNLTMEQFEADKNEAKLARVADLLGAFVKADTQDQLKPQIEDLVSKIISKCTNLATPDAALDTSYLLLVESLWKNTSKYLNPGALQSLDYFVSSSLPGIIVEGPRSQLESGVSLLFSYIQHRQDSDLQTSAWQAVFSVLPAADAQAITAVVSAVVTLQPDLPANLPSAHLDDIIRNRFSQHFLSDATSSPTALKEVELFSSLLQQPGMSADRLRHCN